MLVFIDLLEKTSVLKFSLRDTFLPGMSFEGRVLGYMVALFTFKIASIGLLK